MDIKTVIATINQMQTEGIVDSYAIGGAVDPLRFQAILARHDLLERWHKFEKQFLSDEL